MKEANYSNGDQYHYTYDAVGNHTEQQTLIGSVPLTTNYVYDAANRLISVDGVPYTWDNNGNLLTDGANSYTYNTANQLTALSGPLGSSTFSYNGLGDRLSQNGVNYTLDLNAGLTQVLSDGTNTYLYGLGRIAENQGGVNEYYLGDALGSVRQLVRDGGEITLARTYEPYGDLAQATGTAQTDYDFTGEFTDSSGLVYLRARYYAPDTGRFFQQDPWDGVSEIPASLNPYLYGLNNPTRYTDPNGENPLAALGALALWVGKGVAVGAVGGALIGCLSYNSAISGQCGCEIQQQALSMTRTEWIGMFALMGGIVGGTINLAVLTPATTIILVPQLD